jgi:integrase/recombinase XerD
MNWTSLVKSYLDQRRELGYQLNSEEQQLLNFASYADEKNFSQPLTIPLACEWASLAPSGSAITIARRTSALRPFSRYLSFINPAYPVLPSRLMGPTHRRLPPFIYSNNDIDGLLAACSSLFTITGLRPITMHTLIGLLLTIGLRPGEGVRLENDNVNLNSGELIINN